MVKASPSDKQLIVNILLQSFADNQSVNHVISTKGNTEKRLKHLMEYSFEMCLAFGEVFLSGDRHGCALVLFPEKKRTTLRSIFRDLQLIRKCIGVRNVISTMRREKAVRDLQPKTPVYYLWFIGVKAEDQGKGIGSSLLTECIARAAILQRTICLETSTLRNLPWYEKFGFKMYAELRLGYHLHFLKIDG